jgi:hypothetical protein
MPASGFDRERLGIGDWPVGEMSYAVIPKAKWDGCIWPGPTEMPRPQRICVSVDITPDQSAATIAVAGILPSVMSEVKDEKTGKVDRVPVVALEIGSDGTFDDHRAGVEWIIPRLKELKSRQRIAAIVIDPIGPGAELITKCENETSLASVLETCQLRDVAQAHAQFLRGIEDVTIVHRDQDDLRDAVAAGVQRDVGDGMHAWARKNTTQDISPLCAGTMAVWAARKFGRGYDVLKSVQ